MTTSNRAPYPVVCLSASWAHPRFFSIWWLLLLAASGSNALAQDEAAASTEVAASPAGSASLFDLILQGGWAMIPLGLLSLAMFYLIFHCWMMTGAKRFFEASQVSRIASQLRASNPADAINEARRPDNVLGRLIAISLEKYTVSERAAPREALENTFAEAAEGEENSVSQWINYLNVIATVAPMVGLLGTVSGMIGAFQTIATGGMGKPQLLAGDIGEALITTATGLVIGIPAMISYFYYRNRLTNRMIETSRNGSELFDQLFYSKVTPEPQVVADVS